MKMRAHDWGDALGAVFILAMIYVLVRPSSLAPKLITDFTNGFTAIVHYAVTQ